MQDDNLTLVYDDFDLQLTICEKVLDENLSWTNHFQHMFQKRYHHTFGFCFR